MSGRCRAVVAAPRAPPHRRHHRRRRRHRRHNPDHQAGNYCAPGGSIFIGDITRTACMTVSEWQAVMEPLAAYLITAETAAGSVVTFSHPDRVSSYHAASWMHRQKYRVPPPPRCRRCCWPVDFNTPDRSSSGSSSGSPRMPRLRAQKTKTLLSCWWRIFPKFGRGPGSVRKQP